MPQDNYDAVGLIQVDATALSATADVVAAQAKAVADAIGVIGARTSELKVNWTGATAESADEINLKWRQTIRGLFGTEEAGGDDELTGEDGVLNVAVQAVRRIAGSYATLERGYEKAFEEFGATGDGGNANSDATPQDVVDPVWHSITADYPPYR